MPSRTRARTTSTQAIPGEPYLTSSMNALIFSLSPVESVSTLTRRDDFVVLQLFHHEIRVLGRGRAEITRFVGFHGRGPCELVTLDIEYARLGDIGFHRIRL